jgi:hypothetical protein
MADSSIIADQLLKRRTAPQEILRHVPLPPKRESFH